MRKDFNVYKRKLKTGERYYIRFWLQEEGRFSPARSAGSLADTLLGIRKAERIRAGKNKQKNRHKTHTGQILKQALKK